MLDIAKVPTSSRFRYRNVLSVGEAPEPTEILYDRCHIPPIERLQGFCRGMMMCLVVVLLTSSAVEVTSMASIWAAAILISMCNVVLQSIDRYGGRRVCVSVVTEGRDV